MITFVQFNWVQRRRGYRYHSRSAHSLHSCGTVLPLLVSACALLCTTAADTVSRSCPTTQATITARGAPPIAATGSNQLPEPPTHFQDCQSTSLTATTREQQTCALLGNVPAPAADGLGVLVAERLVGRRGTQARSNVPGLPPARNQYSSTTLHSGAPERHDFALPQSLCQSTKQPRASLTLCLTKTASNSALPLQTGLKLCSPSAHMLSLCTQAKPHAAPSLNQQKQLNTARNWASPAVHATSSHVRSFKCPLAKRRGFASASPPISEIP